MSYIYNLNSNVKIADLYKDSTKEQIRAIEKAAKGGFTVDELKSLEEEGIDTSLIKQNSTKEEEGKTNKPKKDVDSRAKEIASKYVSEKFSGHGDKYSSKNPELKALDKALDDGIIKILSQEGYSKSQIVEIISIAFPNVGIKKTGKGNSYDRPKGHDAQAQKIYSRFSSHLAYATGTESKEIKEKRDELKKINNTIAHNNHQMQVLEVTIDALQQDVEEQIDEAIKESKDIQEENKKKAQEAVKKRLNEYSNSDGQMSYQEFQNGISNDLNGIKTKTGRELSDVVNSLLDANCKMSLLKGYVEEISTLNKENKELSKKATNVKSDLDKLVEEAMENADNDKDANLTDPIGFSNNTARFDFFVDKDSNNDITNENEFLGAKSGFNEMRALDKDGDGKVTGTELDSANVKIIQTNKDGSQQIVSASSIFKNATDGIDLNSYKNVNQDIGDGNKLLGTFSANINGQNFEGYQTLDRNEWLDKNYEFSDEVNGIGRFAQDNTEIIEAHESSDKINIFTLKNEELEGRLKEAWSAWGFSEDMADAINNASNSEAKRRGNSIKAKFEEIAKKEEEAARWSEEEMKKDLEKWKELEEAENKKDEDKDEEEDKDEDK